MKNNYSRENYIDSLRGIAILFVVIFHYHITIVENIYIELKIGHWI